MSFSGLSRRGLAASRLAGAKSHLDTIPGFQLIPASTACARWQRSGLQCSIFPDLALLQSWHRVDVFGQMAFSRDILLRWGSRIASICFDTAWGLSDAPDSGQVCENRGEGGREGVEQTRQQRTLCLKMRISALHWFGGQACCCSGELRMTFYSDFTIQMTPNKASPYRSYVMREAELLMEDYSLNCRKSSHPILHCAVYTYLPPLCCIKTLWQVEVRRRERQFLHRSGKCMNLNLFWTRGTPRPKQLRLGICSRLFRSQKDAMEEARKLFGPWKQKHCYLITHTTSWSPSKVEFTAAFR